MRTLTLILLFLLTACDQPPKPAEPPSVYVRQGRLCAIDRIGPTTFRYRCTEATTLRVILLEIRYAGGSSEVWAVPHGCTVVHAPRKAWCKVYPVQLDRECKWPLLIYENGDGSVQTTTGAATDSGRVTMAQESGGASWEILR